MKLIHTQLNLFEKFLVKFISNSYGSEDSDGKKRERENEGKYIAGRADASCARHHRNASLGRFLETHMEIYSSGWYFSRR